MPKRTKASTTTPSAGGRNGRIITFYSYKGGTGRSMALANVAWILASQGKQVLVIDWDLEAPGLHRYFRPFIEDKEQTSTRGLIDFLEDFVRGARVEAGNSKPAWFERYSHLERLACSLDWDFPGQGTVDLVSAGRQGPSYAGSVTAFAWDEFYELLGGGVFLEAVKRNLRAEYDYVLIDSRTGISDSSGICTIQMPDDLVVCFTLNTQSILGAVATAESAFQQRMTPERVPGIRVWPVPMRVELAERDRLERARDDVRSRFQKFLHHLPSRQRETYWGGVEVMYQPYFAYEEVLAALAERPQQAGALIQSFERITSYLTNREVTSLGKLNESRRRKAIGAYANATPGPFYLSYSRPDREMAGELANGLRRRLGSDSILIDRDFLHAGDPMAPTLLEHLNKAQVVVPLISRAYLSSPFGSKEAEYALSRQMSIVPVLLPGMSWNDVRSSPTPLAALSQFHGYPLEAPGDAPLTEPALDTLAAFLSDASVSVARRLAEIDQDDPNRGRFGGLSKRAGYELTAKVTALTRDWFDVQLRVAPIKGGSTSPLTVEFHLHPTFEPAVRRVAARSGRAPLQVEAFGAFTVGAVVLDSLTVLELDLSKLKAAPVKFRKR